MTEKLAKIAGQTGVWNLVIGIVAILVGVASGVMLIVNGARLLKSKDEILF